MVIDVLRERQLMYMKVYSTCVSPNENIIAAATSAGSVVTFSLSSESLSKTKKSTKEPAAEISVMANRAYSLSSTSHHLLCGDSRGIIRAWKWDSVEFKGSAAQVAFSINISNFSRSSNLPTDVNSMVVTSDNSNLLYAGCGDSLIYCFDLSCGKLIRSFDGHSDYVHQVVHSSEKQQLFSCSEDGFIKIWDTRSSQQIGSVNPASRRDAGNPGGWIGCIAVDDSGDFLTFGGGVQMGIYNIPTASFAATLEPSSLEAHCAVYSGDKLLVGGQTSKFFVYSVDGQLENEIRLPNLDSIYSITPCLNNVVTAVAGGGSKIEIIRHYAYNSATLTIS